MSATTEFNPALGGETEGIVKSVAGLNAFAGKQFGVMRTVSPLVWNLLLFWIKIKKIVELLN